MTVTVPQVHLNGTSRDELLKQLREAHEAVSEAMAVMANATPHDRDYYVISDTAGPTAREQHYARLAKLEEVRNELAAIHQGVYIQGR